MPDTFTYQGREWQKQKVYYWNARFNRKTCLLSGPFLSAAEAEATADYVSPILLAQCPEAAQATFGVMECNAPGPGEGRYNEFLPAHLVGSIAVGRSIN